MRNLNTYIDILHKKGLYTCLQEACKVIQPIWWTTNKAVVEQILQERHYNYLKRQYGSYCQNTDSETPTTTAQPKIIWLCWLQGLENAPKIVQKFVQSVKKYAPDYEIRLLTADNLFQYVTLPNFIIEKYNNRTISFTHFSNILRTCLLCEHGGIWIDATVLLTNKIPEYITNQPLFFFQPSWLQNTKTIFSRWFIAAQPNHPLLKQTRELLFKYWEKHNILKDYYLFHLLFAFVVTENPNNKKIFDTIPYVQNVDAHTLQFKLDCIFTQSEWQNITQRSSIHKLTYKLRNSGIDNPNSYYQYIINSL